ncbi:CHAT domain-containing protein [Amycolatopsis alba DSM 44262]|uniref:CHAT domain-containing protein n=1 Tax=Amycolatopsis alba DSM 44262 TaxID=1125972 RepID=A0A229S183_AMYAL|nr:CHAT domain-containing protein [Amycolatopsis alba DSM 44262]
MSARLAEFTGSGKPEMVFTKAITADAEALAPMALSGTDDQAASACQVLGWLYFFRCSVLDTDAKYAELAKALTFLTRVADQPAALPEPVRALIGPLADTNTQAEIGRDLLLTGSRSPDPHLLDSGIMLLSAAVAGDPRAGSRIALLIVGYQWRYRRTRRVDDLERAIETGEHAIRVLATDHPEIAGILSNLGVAYRSRFGRTDALPDLNRSIELTTTAANSCPDGDPQRLACLANLADTCCERSIRTGDLGDLAAAIGYAEQALASTPAGDPEHASCLARVGAIHFRRYERLGDVADLRHAIEFEERALAAEPDLFKPLTDLCVLYRERYQRLGEVADLRRAVESGERALASLPGDDARRSIPASMLNLACRHLYEATQDLDQLRRAVGYGRLAVSASPAGSPDRASALGNLSPALQRLYEHTGLLSDLQQAIDVDEEALALLPDGHPTRITSLSNLCVAYRSRAEHTEASADRARAIELGERALAAIPADDPTRIVTVRTVSAAYREQFKHHGDITQLNRAIELAQLALDTLPADHPTRHRCLSDLNTVHQLRHRHSADAADIRRGIEFQEQALACLPSGHPDLALVAANLGQAHHQFATTTGRPVDEDRLGPLIDVIVASAATASTTQQVRSYHVAGRVATVLGDHLRAAALLDSAAALLPSLPPSGANWRDREYRIGQYTGLVRESIAAHCAVDDPAGAVEAAERGRGILLAAELGVSAGPVAAPAFPELRTAAADGAVVLVNTDLRQGEAIIVTATGDPIHVRLPGLGGDELHQRVQHLIDVNQRTGFAAVLHQRRVVPDIVGWLWDVAVAPILAALPDTDRVWWMPTDLLGLFPWHAAGHPGEPGALDAVVSSYTATLRTLSHARSRPPSTERRQLTVAVRDAQGAAPLPATVSEAEHLHGAHPGLPLLIDENATADAVLTALRGSTWAHFACHADADLLVPSRSGIRLYDGILTLSEISRLRLADAELAYLSACSTANPGITQADESLHLASAFQLAGFRHVIATLWPIADDVAATTAREIYRHLDGTPSADSAAHAVRRATLQLRAEHPDRPDLWASLIHNGP